MFYYNDLVKKLRERNEAMTKEPSVVIQLVTLVGELTENYIVLEKKHNELTDRVDELEIELERANAMLRHMQDLATKPNEEVKQQPTPADTDNQSKADPTVKLHTDICDMLWKVGYRALMSGTHFNWDEFIAEAVRLSILSKTGVDIQKLYEEEKAANKS